MKINPSTLISDIVANNYKSASIFKKYEIDFCCNGNRALAEVCLSKNIGIDNIVLELENTLVSKAEHNYQSWEIGFLSDYIYNNHHLYVEEKTPEIKGYLDKICEVHGEQHPELFKIRTLFNESAIELLQHMQKEESILFPYFKKLTIAKRSKVAPKSSGFGTIKKPIEMMHKDHDNEGHRFREISKLSNHYNPPVGVCNTYKVTFAMLKEFEADLHKHIHLENNILFRKAIELEAKLAVKSI